MVTACAAEANTLAPRQPLLLALLFTVHFKDASPLELGTHLCAHLFLSLSCNHV
jgi:hypothetical protein